MKRAYFVAGGTGGHILPAIALGTYFRERLGFKVQYVSGKRHLDYKLYQGEDCIHLSSYALVGKSIDAVINSIVFNSLCFFQMLFKFIINRPKFVFGAGGYVCGPTLLAAKVLGIKTYILEQNSVMGMTNKILARIANIIFINFSETKGIPESKLDVVKHLGNPVRKEFLSDMYREEKNPRFRILIIGGSLGSGGVNDLIVKFLEDFNLEREIEVYHQIGKNKTNVKAINSAIIYQQTEYIENLPEEFKKADFIICRGGATTVTELRFTKTPSLIIPTPLRIHKDRHQVYNGESLKKESKFPVFIHAEEELGANHCSLLLKIISDELNRDKTMDKSWFEEDIHNPTEKIAKVILEDV